MKKLWVCILMLATPAFADIAVTPGVGKTVASDPVNSREYQTVKIIDGTTAGTSSMTVTAGGAALFTSSGIPASQQGTWTIQPGNTQNTTSWLFTTTASVVSVNLVSSTTLPSPLADGTTTTLLIDSVRRTIVTDIPVEVISSTWNVNISSNTNELILVSSAAATVRTRMCGCIFKNGTATNTGFTLYQSSSAATNPFYPIGAPANYVPAGIRNDCGHPFLWSVPGGEITIRADVVTSSTSMNCTYFQK